MSNANTPAMMAQSMAESLFRENARLKKIEESYYRLLELDSGDVMIDTLNENDRLKEQNALLTVQVQEAQAKIDRLMLEYCPAEMPEEQVANWGMHQQAVQVCPECDIAGCRHIRSALPQRGELG